MTVTPSVHRFLSVVSMTFSGLAILFGLTGMVLCFAGEIYPFGLILVGAVLQVIGSGLTVFVAQLNVPAEMGSDHE